MSTKLLKKIIAVFFAAILFLSTGISAKAYSRTYSVSNYDININITPDGSANVEERIRFSFDGEFNGVYLNIDTSGSDGIENMKLSCLKKNNETEIVNSDSQQPETYTLTKEDGINKYKVYEPSDSEKKTFIFRYKLLNVIRNYSDTAEFDRLVIPKNWETDLKNIKVTVTLPDGAKKEDLKVYAHGPLTGTSQIIDNKTVQFTVPEVPAHTFVESIVLFPVSLTPGSKYVSTEQRLPAVISRESKLADEANKEREAARQEDAKEKRERAVQNYIILLFIAFWIFVILYIYKKYDKELKPEFQQKYFRELPGDYSPAVMSMLINNDISAKDIMATILDLTRRKYVTIEKIVDEKQGILRKSKKEDYKVTLINKDYTIDNNLKEHEKCILNWLINAIGDGTQVTFNSIKKYASKKENAGKFNSSYETWKNKVKKDFEKQEFYDKSIKAGKITGILFGLSFIFASVILIGITKYFMWIVLLILGIISVIYSSLIKRKTKYGNEQYSMWMAFKRFLQDFSQMKNANISSIVIWEHYLVYAVSLGVAHNIIKYIPVLAGVQEPGNAGMVPDLIFWQLGGFDHFDRSFNDCIHTINSAVISAHDIAISANSSGSGSGGGFSGGGGFGGGGGGGGGAF